MPLPIIATILWFIAAICLAAFFGSDPDKPVWSALIFSAACAFMGAAITVSAFASMGFHT